MRTPGGRDATTNYLRKFREFPRPYVYVQDPFFTNLTDARLSPDLPEFPIGTTFALVRQAIDRGIHFEILYTAAMHDAISRRNLIANTIALVNASKANEGGK